MRLVWMHTFSGDPLRRGNASSPDVPMLMKESGRGKQLIRKNDESNNERISELSVVVHINYSVFERKAYGLYVTNQLMAGIYFLVWQFIASYAIRMEIHWSNIFT